MWFAKLSTLVLLAALAIAAQNGRPQPLQTDRNTTEQSSATSTTRSGIRASIPTGIAKPAGRGDDDKPDHAWNEQVIAKSTLALAIITGLLFFATAVLAWFTFNLWGATNELAADTKNAAAEQAKLTRASVEQMERAANAAGASASEAGRQVNVAVATLEHLQQEFRASHRPRLRLRRIYFAGSGDPLPKRDHNYDPLTGIFSSSNSPIPEPSVIIEMAHVDGVGVAKATLYITFGIYNTGQPEPGRIQEELAKATPQNMEVSHAGSGVIVVEVPAVAALFYDSNVQNGGQSVYCVGYVVYSDETGEFKGRTGFIRRCNVEKRWFERVDFPDFEYAD